MKSKVVTLMGILAAISHPAFAEKSLIVPVPEGGTGLVYVLLAGVSCLAAMFLSGRKKRARL